jgi:hypothetical protein
MKRKIMVLIFALALLVWAATGLSLTNFTSANPYAPTFLPKININADGSITPDTGYIARNGNTYTLTSDIIEEYSIDIWRSNIIFDGQGHTIRITNADNYNVLQGVTNVTVKNLQVYTGYIAISLASCSNCTVTGIKSDKQISIEGHSNMLTQSNTGVAIHGNENLISKNNLSYIFVDGASNTFSKNNIFLTDDPSIYSDNFWDDGAIGNYWGNYTLKYSNISEIGNSGIGNMPYVIDRGDWSKKQNPNAINIDHFPLMFSYDIEKDQIALPEREPLVEPETAVYTAQAVLVVGASTASIAGAVVGLFYYRKKHKRLLFNKPA